MDVTVRAGQVFYIEAESAAHTVVENGGPDTIYYGTSNAVTTSSYQGSVAAGGSVTFSSSKWIVSAGVSLVDVSPLGQDGGVSVTPPDREWLDAVDYATLQEALDDAAGKVLVVRGAQSVTEQLTVPSDTTVIAHGATFTPSGFNSSVVLFDSPTARTPTTTYALTANPAVGDLTVTVSSGNSANLAAGDVVTLRDPTYTLGGETVRREMNVVESVNTGTGVITLRYPVGHAYTTANSSWIAKVTMAENIRWYGGTFDMSGIAGGIAADCDAIEGLYAENCLVEGVTFHDHPDKGVSFWGALNSTIRDCNAYSPSRVGPGEGYCGQLVYSRNCQIIGGWSQNIRHHADIVGGQACDIIGGSSVGRTTDFNSGASLHGMESRWCRIIGFRAANVSYGVLAGNGTFGDDYDFEIIDCSGRYCDRNVYVTQGSTGRIVGGHSAYSNGADSPVVIADTASVDIAGMRFTGTSLRAVHSTSSGRVSVRDCKFDGTISEAVRADAGTLVASDNMMADSGVTVGVRAAISCTKVTLGRNVWGGVTTKLSNTAGATVVGVVDVLTGTATWDPSSIADDAMTSTTVTVTGAAVGDPVQVGFSNAVPAGALLVGQVTAANTVTVTLHNNTGSALDLASGTLRATVTKHS